MSNLKIAAVLAAILLLNGLVGRMDFEDAMAAQAQAQSTMLATQE